MYVLITVPYAVFALYVVSSAPGNDFAFLASIALGVLVLFAGLAADGHFGRP